MSSPRLISVNGSHGIYPAEVEFLPAVSVIKKISMGIALTGPPKLVIGKPQARIVLGYWKATGSQILLTFIQEDCSTRLMRNWRVQNMMELIILYHSPQPKNHL